MPDKFLPYSQVSNLKRPSLATTASTGSGEIRVSSCPIYCNLEEKIGTCRRLRAFLQTELGLNSRDETAVVLGAMREGGYDPDRSRAHLRGCLTSEDIESARRAGFRWGSCDRV